MSERLKIAGLSASPVHILNGCIFFTMTFTALLLRYRQNEYNKYMSNAIFQAANELAQRRIQLKSSDRLAPSLRPASITEAIDIQSHVSRILGEQINETIAGWKSLLPPADKCIVGPIYSSCTHTGATCPILPIDGMAAIEPEIAFVFGKSLMPRDSAYSFEEVLDAIASTHLAFELIKSRYNAPDDCEFPELLADGLFNQGLFIGPAIQPPAPASCAITIETASGSEVLDGKHPNDNAYAPIVWLINFLSEQGISLKQGNSVITGSYAGVVKVPLNEVVSVNYEGLGTITTQFLDKTIKA